MPQLLRKWFQEQTGQAGGFKQLLPAGLSWGSASICKPLVWCPLEQNVLIFREL